LATRRPADQPRHVGLHPGFVEKDQPADIELGLQLGPELARRGDVLARSFARLDGLFFSVRPSRRTVFHIVPTLTETPIDRASQARRSSNVPSDCSRTRRRMASSCSASRRGRAKLTGPAVIRPSRSRRWRALTTEETLTSRRSATSRALSPSAASTRSRKSCEE